MKRIKPKRKSAAELRHRREKSDKDKRFVDEAVSSIRSMMKAALKNGGSVLVGFNRDIREVRDFPPLHPWQVFEPNGKVTVTLEITKLPVVSRKV